MKRKVIIPLVVFLAILGIGAAIKYRPHTVPWEECSEVYRRYATTDGIRASYIKDYRVNDTITLNVTLLEATDSAGWDTLCNSFNNHPAGYSIEALNNGIDVLALLLGNTRHDCGMTDNEVAVASFINEYICIFHNLDSNYRNKLTDAIYDKIFNALKYNQKFIENEKNS